MASATTPGPSAWKTTVPRHSGRGTVMGLLGQVVSLRLGDVTQVPIVPRLLSGLRVVQLPTQIVTNIHDRRVQVLLVRGGDDLLAPAYPALQGDLLTTG